MFLDGADADGRRIGLRVPGRAIADGEGAVVGRNPFESPVVLDHDEVSRRHVRLLARETAVLVEDLHSLNGTALDDSPADAGRGGPGAPRGGQALVALADNLRFGDVEMSVDRLDALCPGDDAPVADGADGEAAAAGSAPREEDTLDPSAVWLVIPRRGS